MTLLLAGCQSQSRRALLLDLSLDDPVLLSGTAEPWHDAGYTVEYRRFYPHLTRADLERYHVVLFLFGSEPEASTDALTSGDLEALGDWLTRGGVAVLGYAGEGLGSQDRATANRWLASQGAAISISDSLLEDTVLRAGSPRPQPWAQGRRVGDDPLGSVYEPFPLDRNHLLHVKRPSQILAVASRHAFVRTPKTLTPKPEAPIAVATRIGDGLVVVMSRHALATLGPQDRSNTAPLLQLDALDGTRDFLTALARWTRRPAEWAHVPPAEHPTRDPSLPPRSLEPGPPPPAAPPGVTVESLPLASPKSFTGAGVPGWIKQQGMRALWTPLMVTRDAGPVARSAASLDSLVGVLDEAGLNLLIGDALPIIVADSLHHHWEDRLAVRRAWTSAVAVLQPTSVAWVPAFDLRAIHSPNAGADSSRGTHGEAIGPWCALDSTLWGGVVGPAYVTLARLAGGLRQLVPALALDFTPTGNAVGGSRAALEFCDAAWRGAMLRMGHRGAVDSTPAPQRYRTLREAGLLPQYYHALEDLVADRARTVRDRVLKERPGLYFAFRFDRAPGDWLTLGMLRGFSLPDRPLLLFTPEVETQGLLAAYHARGVDAVHAIELRMDVLRVRNLAALKKLSFVENDGFWVSLGEGRSVPGPETGRAAGDSLTQALRRLTR